MSIHEFQCLKGWIEDMSERHRPPTQLGTVTDETTSALYDIMVLLEGSERDVAARMAGHS